jgi:hypothetical protein
LADVRSVSITEELDRVLAVARGTLAERALDELVDLFFASRRRE